MKRAEPIIDITVRFNEAIAYLAKEIKGFTQSKFAAESSLSPAAITESIKLRSNVGVMAIQNIVKNYNVSPEWLMLGQGEMFKIIPESKEKTIDLDYFEKKMKEKEDKIESLFREIGDLKLKLGNLKSDVQQDDGAGCVDAEKHQQAG